MPDLGDEAPSLLNDSLPLAVNSFESSSSDLATNGQCNGFSVDSPFHMLTSESILSRIEFSTRSNCDPLDTFSMRTLIVLTQYRLLVRFVPVDGKASSNSSKKSTDAFYNILLRCIDNVELRELFYLYVFGKDGRLARITFDNNENCVTWHRLISEACQPLPNFNDLFAFKFFGRSINHSENKSASNGCIYPGADREEFLLEEFQRLQFNPACWRISNINAEYRLCSTYPKHWIVPVNVTDEEVESASRYRSMKRLAAVVWRHRSNGAVLLRSSQPESGIFGWRSPADEHLVKCMIDAAYKDSGVDQQSSSSLNGPSTATVSSENKKPLLILDARSYTAAWANRAKGGGFENKENYCNCDIEFLGLANIHAIRSSFQKLRSLLWDSNNYASTTHQAQQSSSPYYYSNNVAPTDTAYLQSLDSCQWPFHLWTLLNSSARVVEALDAQGRCVLVHCSDGWDRTTQIVALAKLMLDPHYRTVNGFKDLIERDWVSFGHKFCERSGLLASGDPSQKSPVFLQWLDCVRYLLREFPTSFEFNEIYLIKLAQHVYSGLFGTFLCNSSRESISERVHERTFSLWYYLNDPRRDCFFNLLYVPLSQQYKRIFSNGCCSTEDRQHKNHVEGISGQDLANKNLSYFPTPAGYVVNRTAPSPYVLTPRAQLRDLTPIWRALFCPGDDPAYIAARSLSSQTHQQTSSRDDAAMFSTFSALSATFSINPIEMMTAQTTITPQQQPHLLNKTQSCEDLTKTVANLRTSDDEKSPLKSDSLRTTNTNIHRSSSDTNIPSAGSSLSLNVDQQQTTCVKSVERSPPKQLSNASETTQVDFNELRRSSMEDDQLTNECNATNVVHNGHLVSEDDVDSAFCTTSSNDKIETPDSKLVSYQDTDMLTSIVNVDCNGSAFNVEKHEIDGDSKVDSALRDTQSAAGSDSNDSNNIIKRCEPKLFFDVDGLRTPIDPVQQRVKEILCDYEKQLELNHLEMQRLRVCLTSTGTRERLVSNFGNGAFKNGLIGSDSDQSECNFEPSSIDSKFSEASWDNLKDEQVDSELRPTLWVPDHATNNCVSCGALFWAINRRHHCRNCGKLFCAGCSNYECFVPQEQLFKRVRVCIKCYELLNDGTAGPPGTEV